MPTKPMVPPWITAPAVSSPARMTIAMRQRARFESEALRGGLAGGEHVERPRQEAHGQRG